jgi:signal transduction histidine kinase
MYTFVVMLSIERLMGVFFEKRRTSLLITIGSYLLFFIFLSIGVLFDIPIFEIFAALTFIVISLNYESSPIKKIVAAVCSYLCIQMIQAIFMVITDTYPNGLENLGSDVAALLFLASGFVNYVIASFLRRFKNIKKSAMLLPVSWISLLIVPLISITMIVTQFLFLAYLPQPIVVTIGIMAVVITMFAFYFQDAVSKAYEDKLKSALNIQEKEYYFTQCRLMQESVESIKSIRHDMKFHLAMARDLAAENKADEAADYLNGLLGDIEKNEIYSNTKNIAFDSIINFKLNNTKQENIKLDIRLLIPPDLNIEVADIVTIIGNLLDNALDAVSKAPEKMIKLDIEYSRASLFIQIENTFDGVVEYAANGNEDAKRIITRKSGGEHGLGLKNIRKSVEKYNGHIDISHDEKIFSVGVLLYVDDSVKSASARVIP